MRRVRSMQNLDEMGIRTGTSSPTPSSGHGGNRQPVISERELREHFNRPLNEVAKKYGMCTTALKKLCRRWSIYSRALQLPSACALPAPHSLRRADTVPDTAPPLAVRAAATRARARRLRNRGATGQRAAAAALTPPPSPARALAGMA